MTRLTLQSVLLSDLPGLVGLCVQDVGGVAAYVNEAQERLIYAGGDTGWFGGWTRVVFQVSVANPYITLPKELARIVNMDICKHPMRVFNEWYEFLPGGPGLMPNNQWPDWWSMSIAGYERGQFPTFTDITPTNQKLRAYLTDTRDADKRLLISGLDQNGNDIWTQDGLNNTHGVYLTLASPFAESPFIITNINGVQKDVTYGDVVLKQVDQTTGAEVTLARYGPRETAPWYRRYYITKLPTTCCNVPQTTTVQVTALGKFEYIPAVLPTDYLIITNLPALMEEVQAIRYSRMDVPTAAALEAKHHRAAIKQLQNQQRHAFGEQEPAVSVNSFEGQALCRAGIGSLT